MSDSNTDHQESKTCSKCKEEKFLDQFNADSRRKDGKRASCKTCDAAQKKRIRSRDLDEYRRRNAENNRNYRARMKSKNTAE
jgi:hypothetical protein